MRGVVAKVKDIAHKEMLFDYFITHRAFSCKETA